MKSAINGEDLDFGVLRNRNTGKTMSVWIYGTFGPSDLSGSIGTEYSARRHNYNKSDWKILYRGEKAAYDGPSIADPSSTW